MLIPATIILLFPFAWLLLTSIETPAEALHFPPIVIPHHLDLGNYSQALQAAPFGRFFLNSAIVAVFTVVSNLVLCSLAGYAFARYRFFGSTLMFVLIMTTLMVPFQVTMIPQYLITKWLGVNLLASVGINHLGALILPNASTAFGMFFLRQFFRTLPIEYEEAARVDGASRLTVLLRIVLPLSGPALSTLAALTFLDSWNNFLWPLIAINPTSQMTLPLGLATFQSAHTHRLDAADGRQRDEPDPDDDRSSSPRSGTSSGQWRRPGWLVPDAVSECRDHGDGSVAVT